MRGWLIISCIVAACGSSPTGGAATLASPDVWTDDSADSNVAIVADIGDASASDCQVGGSCQTHNDFGTCTGMIIACANGQATCDAPTAAPETCNQKDDDCNGVTDDNLCEDSDPCTAGSCVGATCVQKPTCDDGDACTSDSCANGTCTHNAGSGCTIGGACVAAGTKDPKDACKVCNPAQSKSGYVGQNGLACDDGDACTTADSCKNGVCHGAPLDCGSSGGTCGAASCVGGKCVASGPAGACKPGNVAACTEPCEENVCGNDCQWQGCALKAGAKCTWQKGSNHQCCAPGSWQFCSKTTCDWYPCQADSQSGCP